MNYPSNSREISFLSTADCKRVFAMLVRELDKLDEEGVFGPFGWRDRLTPPPRPTQSASAQLREDNAKLAGSAIGGASDFGSEGCQFDPSPASQLEEQP